MSAGSNPGIGPRDVSIITSASTRSGARQRDLARDHPAHRVAEEAEPVEADRVGDLEDVGREPVERVRAALGRLVARTVAAVIEDDDGVVAREHGNVVGEVLLGAAEPVHQQQPRARARHLDLQPDTVVVVIRMTPWSPETRAIAPAHATVCRPRLATMTGGRVPVARRGPARSGSSPCGSS